MFEDRFDIDPRRVGHETDQDPPETQPVRDTWPVTTQRMIIDPDRQQRLDRPPDHIHNFGLERAHDDKDLHPVVVLEQHPGSNPGRHDDRWMVTYPRDPVASPTMSSRRVVTFTLLALVGVALIVGIVKVLDEVADPAPHAGGLPLSAILSRATPAQAPFAGLDELKVAVGYDHCLRLAVADSLEERVAGLRDRTDLGPYDGMLFVFQGPSDSAFTMSGVTVPLDIAFFGADGARNSTRLMKPCPKAEPECPVYRADGAYEYAIETLKGQLPAGAATACTP